MINENAPINHNKHVNLILFLLKNFTKIMIQKLNNICHILLLFSFYFIQTFHSQIFHKFIFFTWSGPDSGKCP